MANVAILDAQGRIIKLLRSVHTPDYEGRDDVLINPTREQIQALEWAPPPEQPPADPWVGKVTEERIWKILKYLKNRGLDIGPEGDAL